MRKIVSAIFRSSRANPKTLWRRYVAALLILAALYVGSHYSSMSAANLVTSDTRIGILTARQEALNQRIILQSLQIATGKDDATHQVVLGEMIDEFEKNHRTILDGGGDDLMRPENSDRLREVFFTPDATNVSLENSVRQFVRQARSIQYGNLKFKDWMLTRIEVMKSFRLFERLHDATEAFEHDSADRAHQLHMVQMAILVAGLLTILLEACLIFWPAHVIARNALDRLEEKSDELSVSNEQLESSLQEAREARLEADQSNRAKSMFLANMSHELRTPLNAIIGFSSMIRSQMFGEVGNERYVEYSNDIERSGQQLLELIGDLMDISQIEIGTAQFDRRDFNVAELIQGVEPLARGWPLARERNITFDDGNAPERFFGDPLRLRQILLNLLSNAIKFTSRGDAIYVIVQAHGDRGLQLLVEDTGRGFDVEDINTLMQPFQRGDNAFTRNREGVGLGLSLVSAFAAMHNGNVVLENAGGGGARVVVTLPPARETEEAQYKAA